MIVIVVTLTIVCIALIALGIWGIVLLERYSDLVEWYQRLADGKDRLIEALKKKNAAQEELNATKDRHIEMLEARIHKMQMQIAMLEVDNENS